ncbi:TPA: energy-coupling factor ABC transporter ATP-binding protein [Streptococcus suis]
MLSVENISYTYNFDFGKVLEDVSMDFDKGQIVGVLGANGSGKSTLMKVIMGLYQPQNGRVFYQEKPLVYSKKALYAYRQEVGIVFQDPEQQLFYSVVEDDVALALLNLSYPEQEIKERVDKALKDMHIEHLRNRPVHYLSYGQKKKVAIAGVLALQPKYLLLDEPTAGLDPLGRDHMMFLMKKLAKQGTKIILTSHDMDLMYDCCDYVYLLDKGRLVLEGDVGSVFLEKETLEKARLSLPWLVKLHLAMGLPLAENEQEFFERIGKDYGKIVDGSRNCI